MMRLTLEDVDGGVVEIVNYDALPSERARDVRWNGVTYRQQRETAEGWTYRDIGEPRPLSADVLDSSRWLTIPPEVVKARVAATRAREAEVKAAAELAAQEAAKTAQLAERRDAITAEVEARLLAEDEAAKKA